MEQQSIGVLLQQAGVLHRAHSAAVVQVAVAQQAGSVPPPPPPAPPPQKSVQSESAQSM